MPGIPGGMIAALAIAGCYVGAGHLASPLRKGEKREAPPHLDIFCTTHYNRTQLNLKKGCVFMKIISQLGIIFGIYWASQIIEGLLPFSFPAGVIGILLLLALLIPGILKAESIREVSDFLTGNLTFFLLPVCSSIMNYVDIIGANLVPFFVICTVSTFVTFFVVYFTVRFTCKRMNKEEEK